jgi:Tfp pilus assembly protein PilN
VIEVNLLPGGKKGAARGNPFAALAAAFKNRGGGGGFSGDGYVAFFAVALSVTIGYVAWSWLGVNDTREELEVRIQEERQDSIRFADVIERTNLLTARNDSIAQRVAIIQEIDAGRYVWSHVLDEVAAAVPDYTWLREVLYVGGTPMQIRINGRAGSIYAVTNFMRRLEASNFLRAVTMDRAEQTPSEANSADLVYIFEFVATYDPPPIDELRTVPLFDGQGVAAQHAVPAPEGS